MGSLDLHNGAFQISKVPNHTSTLIFPDTSGNFSKVFSDIRRSSFTILNRLRSIEEDSEYIRQIAERYNRPLVANERCGSWYIPPDLKADSVYFKSTDGHYGQWSFSFRRLNTNVLDLIGRCDGCIIVDSTKRGKLAPDALSKTIPIWCSVINSLLFPNEPTASALYTHDAVVSATEHSQIQRRISSFVEGARHMNLDLNDFQKRVQKPLVPILLMQSHPGDYGIYWNPSFLDTHHPVYLAMASKYCVDSSEESSRGYIQGAGDDTESWSSCGLTPELYWKNQSELLMTSEENLSSLLTTLQFDMKPEPYHRPKLIWPTSNVHVSSIADACVMTGANLDIIVCSSEIQKGLFPTPFARLIYLKCNSGKSGSRELRKELPKIDAFMKTQSIQQKILVCCETGRDLAIGVALAILCRFTDDQGTLTHPPAEVMVDKLSVRRKLAWIMTSIPTAKPSRETLKAVNSFLIKQP